MPVHFRGTVSVTWLTEAGADRGMELNQDFGFEDSGGLVWTAKRNAKINGASIPWPFWSTFGSPFIGDYRRASVLHDYYCEVKTRPSRQTHYMFYEACLAGGVGVVKAKIMYSMVVIYGESWTVAPEGVEVNGRMVVEKGGTLIFSRTMPRAEFLEIIEWIEAKNPPIEEIDAEIARRSTIMPFLPIGELGIAVE